VNRGSGRPTAGRASGISVICGGKRGANCAGWCRESAIRLELLAVRDLAFVDPELKSARRIDASPGLVHDGGPVRSIIRQRNEDALVTTHALRQFHLPTILDSNVRLLGIRRLSHELRVVTDPMGRQRAQKGTLSQRQKTVKRCGSRG